MSKFYGSALRRSFYRMIVEHHVRLSYRSFHVAMMAFVLTACVGVLPNNEPVHSIASSRTNSIIGGNSIQNAGATRMTTGGRIDRTFTAAGNLTGDGSLENMKIHVTGDSMTSPFSWSLVITGENRAVIFKVERNDSEIDKLFEEDGYESECSGYIACKKQYYFKDLPTVVFDSLKPTNSSESKNAFLLSNLRETATTFFDKRSVPAGKREQALSEMRRTLTKPGFRVLDVPYSPVQWDSPAIWVKSIQMFVPYHKD
ncbi:MAG: hypothetical protein ACREPQ_05190 [Rhodanobacter sp.]